MLLPVLFSLAYHNKIHKLKSTIKVSVDFVSDESYLPDLQIAEKDRQTESSLSLSVSPSLSGVCSYKDSNCIRSGSHPYGLS